MKNMLSIALSLLIAAIGFIPGGKGYNVGIISNRDKDSPTVIISVDCIEREHCTEINNLDKVTIVSEHGEDDALVGVNGPEDYEVINEDGYSLRNPWHSGACTYGSYIHNNYYHWKECSVCGNINSKASHTWVTYGANYRCSVCGKITSNPGGIQQYDPEMR